MKIINRLSMMALFAILSFNFQAQANEAYASNLKYTPSENDRGLVHLACDRAPIIQCGACIWVIGPDYRNCVSINGCTGEIMGEFESSCK